MHHETDLPVVWTHKEVVTCPVPWCVSSAASVVTGASRCRPTCCFGTWGLGLGLVSWSVFARQWLEWVCCTGRDRYGASWIRSTWCLGTWISCHQCPVSTEVSAYLGQVWCHLPSVCEGSKSCLLVMCCCVIYDLDTPTCCFCTWG